jgi:hypothetical protein
MSFEDTTEGKLTAMCEDGEMLWQTLALACMAYMSEDDITDMARVEELIDLTEEEVTFEVRDDDSGKVMYTTDDMDLADEEAQVIADSQQKVMTIFQITDNGGCEDELDSYYP